ncbi:hypothetical protein [Spirosoma fluminis]
MILYKRILLVAINLVHVWLIGGSFPASAQLKITHPVSRMVLQRNADNQASVQIAGSYHQFVDVVEARAVARKAGQGTTTAWTTIQTNPTNGQFSGRINVTGGWYTLQVRGWSGGNLVGIDSVDRVGVGEVFAVMGHSNAQGSSCIISGVDKCPTIDGASDDRVTVVALDQNTSQFQQYLTTADTRYLPGLAFSQLLTRSGSAPFAQEAWLWGRMGDELVKRINVPVLIYNAGFGGSNMQQTYWAAYDIPFEHFFIRYDLRMPYANLRNLMNLYVPSTGIRAVLVQHGENDRSNPADSTYKYYAGVIDKLRTEFNKPNLGVVVAYSSFVSGRFENVRSAQYQIINRAGYNAFQGPDLDNINAQADRPDGIHFSPTGQVKAGDLWAAAIHSVYASSNPYPAESQPLVAIQCADSNQLTLSQPSNYQYRWSTGSTVQRLTVGAGTYSARVKDSLNRIFFPPAVVVPTTVTPASPVLSSDNGTWAICRRSGLKLTSSYTGLNTWSTGLSSSSIVVTEPGVYTVQAKNPVYGCLSGVVSQTVTWAPVDLGLSLETTRRIVMVYDTVRFRLLLQNKSDCDAGAVTVQSRLPPNMNVVSTSNAATVEDGVVRATVPGIPAGSVVNVDYVTRLSAAGTYRTSAELIASTNTDLNAIPNNGTANGEDDEALADVRTTATSSALYESPNPDQRPLPPVLPNQPVADPSKADLSVQVQLSRQVLRVNQQVDIILTVRNQGGLTATAVGVQNVLPAGLAFVGSASGMQGNGTVVNGTIGQIPAGESVRLTFTANVTTSGLFTNQVQIMSVDQADPDSVPGNGYDNGEDDQASVTLRAIQ